MNGPQESSRGERTRWDSAFPESCALAFEMPKVGINEKEWKGGGKSSTFALHDFAFSLSATSLHTHTQCCICVSLILITGDHRQIAGREATVRHMKLEPMIGFHILALRYHECKNPNLVASTRLHLGTLGKKKCQYTTRTHSLKD